MSHPLILLTVTWLVYVGCVATVATAGVGERRVGAVATGGLFLAAIASLLVLL